MKLLLPLGLSLFFFLNSNLFAQCEQWVLTGGNSDAEIFFSNNAVVINSEKDIFFAAKADSFPIVLDNQLFGNDNLLAGGILVLGKVDSTGSYDWINHIEFNDTGFPHSLATDGTDIYLISTFRDSFVINQQLYFNREWGIVIVKISSDGVVQWVNNYELQPSASPGLIRSWTPGITCDSEGNVIVTGYFSARLALQTTTLEANMTGSHREAFVIKLDGQGNELWAVQSNSLPVDDLIYSRGWGIEVDKNDDIIVGGFFTRQISFDTITVSSMNDSFVPYLAKISGATGGAIWMKNGSFPSTDTGFSHFYDIAVDRNNDIVAVGFSDTELEFGDTVLEGSNTKGIIVVKVDEDGNSKFARNFGSEIPIIGLGGNAATAVEIDANNNIFFSGFTNENAIFDNLTTPNYNGVFLATLNPIGEAIDLDHIGGRNGGVSSYSIAYDKLKSIYVVGNYTNIDTIFYNNERDTIATEYKNAFFLWKVCTDSTLLTSVKSPPSAITISSLLFPNPTQDYIQLELNAQKSEQVSINIVTETGQVMTSFERNLRIGENTLSFEVDNLPTGIYFLHFKSKGEWRSYRFVKL